MSHSSLHSPIVELEEPRERSVKDFGKHHFYQSD